MTAPPTLQDCVIRRHVLSALQKPASSVLDFGVVIPKFLADQVATVRRDFEQFRRFSFVKVPDDALVVAGGEFERVLTVKNCRKADLSYFFLCVENGLDEEFCDFYRQHSDLFEAYSCELPSLWVAYTVCKWSLAPVVEFTQLWSCCDACIAHNWNHSLRRVLKRAKAEFADRFFEIQELSFFFALRHERVESLKITIEADPALAEQASLKREALERFAHANIGTKMMRFALVASRDDEEIFRFLKTFNANLTEFERQTLTRMFSMHSPESGEKEIALNQLRKLLFE